MVYSYIFAAIKSALTDETTGISGLYVDLYNNQLAEYEKDGTLISQTPAVLIAPGKTNFVHGASGNSMFEVEFCCGILQQFNLYCSWN